MTQIFDLGKLRFHFKGTYDPEVQYELNDVVKFGGGCYVYTHILKSTGISPANESHWGHLSSGTVYQGEYDADKEYAAGDIVSFGANVYFCAKSNTGLHPTDSANTEFWVQYSEGLRFVGEYDPATTYYVGDLVRNGACAFVATQDVHDVLPEVGSAHWELFSEGVVFVGEYDSTTVYVLGDVVRVKGKTHVARKTVLGVHPSGDTSGNWEVLTDGLSKGGRFSTATEYVPGEIVGFGANSYICVQRSTGEFPTNAAKFELLTVGSGVPGVWDAQRADYAVNEQVTYGALTYKVVAGGFAAAGVIPEGSDDWALVAEGTAFTGAFVAGTEYKKGDLAMYGPNTFRRTATGVSANFDADKAAGLWVDHTYGIRWMGVVQAGVTYHPGEVVSDYTNSYICKKTTTAVENQDFSSAGNESSDWDIVSRGQEYFPHPVPSDYGSVIASTVEGGFLLTRQSVAVEDDTQAVIYQHLFVDTNVKEESIVITLPVANEFSRGISVTITDVAGYADVHPIIIKTPDGARIEGQDDAEFHIDAAFGSFKLVFFNTTQGWKVL